MIENKEYVKEIATKFYTVLDPKNSDPSNDDFKYYGYLGSWIKTIDDEEFDDYFSERKYPVYSNFYIIVPSAAY